MDRSAGVNRVILVVLDGLRADSIALFPLPQLAALARGGAATFAARTVQPSITAAAMTSLCTGVAPATHGVTSNRFGVPRGGSGLELLPRLLSAHDHPVDVFMRHVPRLWRMVGTHAARAIGAEISFAGNTADGILDAALPLLLARHRGLQVLHWHDADRAGHADGWTSAAYVAAARRMDAALGRLVTWTGILHDPSTVLIACADHGGGGGVARDHEADHPLDWTIPIVIAGGGVRATELNGGHSLLDIPATIAWLLGVPQPASYSGRPMTEAFGAAPIRKRAAGALVGRAA